MPLKERQKVLELLKSFVPELYQKLIAADPTGKDHLAFDSDPTDASVSYSSTDGLPKLAIGKEISRNHQEELRFILGHELGHYVLDHSENHYPLHCGLKSQKNLTHTFTGGKKSNYLPFEETFSLAYSRTKENEADRFAILTLGTSIDAAITLFQNDGLITEKQYTTENKPLPTAFALSHPFIEPRIAHLENLRREVEVQKLSGVKPLPIDWHALIEKHKNGTLSEF